MTDYIYYIMYRYTPHVPHPMKKIFALLLFMTLLPTVAFPQNSKKVKALQKQKTELQNVLKKSQSDLTKTKKEVRKGQQDLTFIGQQLNERIRYIQQLEKEMEILDKEIDKIQGDIKRVERELQAKRRKLKMSIRYARTQKEYKSTLLFVLSAKTVTQMYRRARYAREYVAYQKSLGDQIVEKQTKLLELRNKQLDRKSKKNDLLHEVMLQRKQLNIQQVAQRKKVDGLKKQESGLAGKIKEQQKQLAALDKKIDQLIAYEIEQARKKAEEAARRKKAAEEAARKKKKSSKSGGKDSTAPTQKTETPSAPKGTWLTAEDRQLNGTFEQNKGRLPVPVTGQYMIGNRFGMYQVPGLKNVRLENKGVNYVGKPGAKARAVFDGEVSAVFQFGGTKNVLIRHGSYISVYCNLSSVIVSKGQKIKGKDIIGSIADDGSGNCVLHFQLRKETVKLNPEAWMGR